MSNLRDMNQPNPLVDMFAPLYRLSSEHPLLAAFNPEARDRGPPPSYDGPRQPNQDANTPPSSDEDPPVQPPPEEGHQSHRGPAHGRHHHHRGGPFGGRGGWGGRGRGWGGRCGGGPNLGGFDMNKLADFISHFSPEAASEMRSREASGNTSGTTGGKDFAPDADIFDTEDAYVVHVSLPGAKKEDVGVNWDADKSELNIAGVIYRPGDEEFLKTLALDERKVGVFERNVKLGSRQNPAQVDSEGITAKMEDGVLIISIPKPEKDFVDVKKVDIN